MGIFDLHRNKESLIPDIADIYTIDLHSHLIPGIDDGAGSFEEALEIISSLNKSGIKKIITTPHMSRLFRNSPEIIHPLFEKLKKRIVENNVDIELAVAAEYLVDEGFQQILESGRLMTFGNKYVLIELPLLYPFSGLSDMLFEMQSRGYNVVLAHPERYLYWQNDLGAFYKLKDREIVFQLNILSLTKNYSAQTHKLALKLIREGLIDVIGTDIHKPAQIPLIKETLTGKLFQELARTGQIKNNMLFA
ncbi:MAG TPA: hypothetical protein PKW80_12305 [Bacteroidales bacterium]|nr:hypothetical protein [Bacteroidales bacterium]